MNKLPQQLPIEQLQPKWASIINPMLANPSLNSLILKDIQLQVGSNSINHRLGRDLQGWRVIRKRGSADIYDTQDDNQIPQLTLSLVSDTVITIDLEVF